MSSHWAAQLIALAAWLGAALLLGLVFGGTAWWLAAALAAYLARTLWLLRSLDRILDGASPGPRFPNRGLWADLFRRIHRARDKARGRKKKYRKLLRQVRESTGALKDGGVILSTDHVIQWFNPAATRLLGLRPATDIGHRIDNLIRHPDFVAYLEAPSGDGVTIPSPRQEEGWLSVQIIPYGREQRLAIVRDITREVTLERSRRDFVANASHELRSPITVIGGYLDALSEDEELPPSWRAPVGEMRNQAQRMARILTDLIDLARLESPQEAEQAAVDVPAMLKALHAERCGAGQGPAVELSLQTDAGLLGRESEIESIVRNLVDNAMRFTPASGRVEIIWREEPDGAVLEVVDTGIGIAPEQIPRITERFYRVDSGRSRAAGGTGLGLAIVKHALQHHDGTLVIESREGVGSRFACHFPAARLARGGTAAKAVV